MRTLLLLALAFGVTVPSVARAGRQGDDYEYLRGPKLKIDRPRSSKSRPDLCGPYPSGGPRHACFRGADAGQRVSANYAGAMGWESGYLRGFTWGLHLGINNFKNDTDSKAAGKADLHKSTLLKDAFAKLTSETTEAARKAGYDHATQLLDAAYEAGEKPVLTLDPAAAQPPAFEAPAHPYEQYVGGPMTPAGIMKEEMKLQGIQVWRLKDFRYVDLEKRLPPWDYYRDNGIYEFDPTPVYDADAALEIYKKSVDRAGYPASEVQIEDEIFKKAYKHFVEYNYADQVYTALDNGLKSGQGLGQGVGKRIAFHEARRQAFNETFVQRAPEIHAGAWKTGFAQGFKKKIDETKKPILTVSQLEIVLETDDGILRPGEGIKIKAVIDNKGLVPGEIAAGLSGSVAQVKPLPIDLKAFTRTQVESGIVGHVDPKLHPRSQATITATVDEETKTMKARVHQIVEIGLAKLAKVDALGGRALLRVGALNPSKVTAPATEIHVVLGGKTRKKLSLGALPAGGKKAGKVAVTGIDPLELTTNRLALEVQIRQGDTVLDQTSLPVIVPDATGALLAHFDQLANGKGWVPEGVSREERLKRVTTAVLDADREEIQSHENGPNIWKGSPGSTLLGKLQKHRTLGNDAARTAHQSLATQLCELHKSFNPIRIQKKRAYKELCEQIARLE